jgi:SAM-dependent methyltransferase
MSVIFATARWDNAMVGERKDVWASGDAYEPYVGRWSRLVGGQFIGWLGVPPKREWLDVGCGTGALCEVILASASPSHVVGIDPSDGFISFARHKVTDPRATFQVGDAQALPVADASFDAAVAGLVPTIFKDFDDYWMPFLGGQAPAPGYCMSLSEDRRAVLRDRIRASLPTRDDGSIHLIARAWAVRGTVP